MDATKLLEILQSGQISPDKVVHEALEKIHALHTKLNAATEILSDDSEKQLRQLTAGALRGLPVSVKECYAMQGKVIRSGSRRMTPITCTQDSVVIRKLKEAGAVVVARGNTSEFLLGRETDNLLYGTTNNSLSEERTAGGSSGGDGSLVGSGCVYAGIGTDIGGSCRYPAVFNGIVGFKPASGLIDKSGIFPSASVPFVETLNSPGILSRSVRDTRLIFNVIADKQLEANDDLKSVELLTSKGFEVQVREKCISDAVSASVDFLHNKTASIRDVNCPGSGSHYKDFVTLMTAGFTDQIYSWSTTSDGATLSFASELFNRLRKKPTLSKELFAMLLPFNLYKPSASRLSRVIEKVEAQRAQYRNLFGRNRILVLPTAGILAPKHRKFIPQYNKPGVIKIITPVSFCNVFNLSCITIPAWKFQSLPSLNPPGIQLVTASGNEELLLSTAEQLENYLAR